MDDRKRPSARSCMFTVWQVVFATVGAGFPAFDTASMTARRLTATRATMSSSSSPRGAKRTARRIMRLARFVALEVVGVRDGQLTANSLTILLALPKLRVLSLERVRVHIDFDFAKLLQLDELRLSSCTSMEFEHVAALKNLRALTMHNCARIEPGSCGFPLLDAISVAGSLAGLTRLEITSKCPCYRLKLIHGGCTSIRHLLRDLPELKDLTLDALPSHHDCNIVQRALESLTGLTRVKLANAAHQYMDASLFANLTSLRDLDLGKSVTTGWTRRNPFARLGGLTRLCAACTGITPDDIAALAPLTALRELDLSGNDLGRRGIDELALACPTALTSLDVSECKLHGRASLALAALPRLERLAIGGNYLHIGKRGFSNLSAIASLRHLDLSGSSLGKNHDALARSLSALARLTCLDLRGCYPPPSSPPRMPLSCSVVMM